MKQKRYGILDNISSPADLRGLSYDTLGVLCAALREFIVDSVSQTGGHLASNLGIVELAVALEREFDSSRDRIIYDVGHQCYVHKILTGRRDRFDTLRQYGGLCGFMKPEESITDPCITGHASDSVSVALGMAHARTLKNQKYHVVAVIGDGALTGGMAYEALSSAGTSREPLLVVLNDNNMSIAKNVGGLSVICLACVSARNICVQKPASRSDSAAFRAAERSRARFRASRRRSSGLSCRPRCSSRWALPISVRWTDTTSKACASSWHWRKK